MSNRKLLLADDSLTIQKVVNLTFADEGIEVTTAGDGDSAMARFSEMRPDIVLADVNMPGLNGYQICEHIRGSEETKDIPVILLVGSFEPFDETEARRVGASAWLTKPFQSIRQLVSLVTDMFNAPPPAAIIESEQADSATDDDLVMAESSQDSPTAETDDIEGLYKQSFTETPELPASFQPEPGSKSLAETAKLPASFVPALVLGDAGMDDEMIETSVAATHRDGQVKQFDFVNPTDIANFDTTDPVINFQPAEVDEREAISFDYEAAVPEHTQDQHNFSEPVETGEPKAFEETPVHSSDTDADHRHNFSESAEMHEPEALAETPVPADESEFAAGELNVLEIPSTNIDPEAESVHTEAISPEFVDAVARKVIEKISESVIRQIAWQIVPQVAERVIREKFEEKSNK